MKNLLFVLILFSVNAIGQIDITGQTLNILPEPKKERKTFWKDFAGYSCFVLAGIANGGREAYHAEPTIFENRFGAGKTSWFGSESWRRKYKGLEPANGEAYWLSTSLFVAPSDYFHSMGTVRNAGILSGSFIMLWNRKESKWKQAAKFGIGVLAYGVSSSLTYNFLRNK